MHKLDKVLRINVFHILVCFSLFFWFENEVMREKICLFFNLYIFYRINFLKRESVCLRNVKCLILIIELIFTLMKFFLMNLYINNNIKFILNNNFKTP